jgi:hypothetical protein
MISSRDAMSEFELEIIHRQELKCCADHARQLADRLARAGLHDQAARTLLDARLYELRAAASRATSRA